MSEDNLTFYEKANLADKLSVIGIPLDIGKDGTGTAKAPGYLRSHGLLEMLDSIGLSWHDFKDIVCTPKESANLGDTHVKYLEEIVRVAEESARFVNQEISAGKKVLALGGDHAISVGTISGASVACGGDLGVIWIDAHGDMMTHENTISGNIHGMPSSAMMGLGHPALTNILKPGSKIKKENIVYIGLKDLDQAEVDLIRREKLTAITVMDLMRHGFSAVTNAVDALNQRVKNIWVSCDVDSIDSQDSPATIMATRGGLSYREITNIARYIGKECSLVGMDLVEVVPDRDVDHKTAQIAIELIAHFFGAEYNWYTQYMKQEAKKQETRNRVDDVLAV